MNVIDISFQRVPIDKQSAFHSALSRRVTKLLDPFNFHDPAQSQPASAKLQNVFKELALWIREV